MVRVRFKNTTVNLTVRIFVYLNKTSEAGSYTDKDNRETRNFILKSFHNQTERIRRSKYISQLKGFSSRGDQV